VTQEIALEWIEQQRAHNYRRTEERRIQTPEEARRFVDEMGFCHFWPIKDVEMPNLFNAIAGRLRPVPRQHDDPDMAKCWRWKDAALGKRHWYYGKLLRKRATLVSLEFLPLFYACSENIGDLDDYLEEYRAGMMTAEAKWIYEALLEHGPLDTLQVREKAGLSSSGSKSRFDRALVELQAGLKVLPVGVARVGRWRYAFTYDILQRHFPDLPGQAQRIERSQARKTLILRYIDNVVAIDRSTIKRIFHVLKWTPSELERTISALLDEGAVRQATVGGLKQPQLVSARSSAATASTGSGSS
jgi:hypothetical protein